MSKNTGQPQTIFQADPQMVEALHRMKSEAYHCCRQHMNRNVQIQTLDGQSFEGTMVGVDSHHVHLCIPAPQPALRQYYPYYDPYNQVILPLVLFDLLAITLL